MATTHTRRAYQELRDTKLKEWIAAERLSDPASKYWERLAHDVTAEATKHAEADELSTERWDEFDQLLNEALDVVESTMRAVNGGYIADDAEIKGWRHHRNATHVALQADAPIIDKDSIEDATAAYLKLPFRSERMDYVLVELLTPASYLPSPVRCPGR